MQFQGNTVEECKQYKRFYQKLSWACAIVALLAAIFMSWHTAHHHDKTLCSPAFTVFSFAVFSAFAMEMKAGEYANRYHV
jgi:hypothetical protein